LHQPPLLLLLLLEWHHLLLLLELVRLQSLQIAAPDPWQRQCRHSQQQCHQHLLSLLLQ
jgi:hypothetical protein